MYARHREGAFRATLQPHGCAYVILCFVAVTLLVHAADAVNRSDQVP